MVNLWPIFDQLLGGVCPLCHAPGDAICASCLDKLSRNHHPCPRCALPLVDGAPDGVCCAECQQSPPPFDRAIAPLRYAAPLDDLVSGFKYHHRLYLGRLLAGILVQALQRPDALPQLLLPVPASAQRLRMRGFNQAAELARWLGKDLEIEWQADRLRRVRPNVQQQGLGRRERQRNLRDAFRCRTGLPSHVALIDDVITTGATAAAASRALRQAGAERIEVWAVARTPLDR